MRAVAFRDYNSSTVEALTEERSRRQECGKTIILFYGEITCVSNGFNSREETRISFSKKKAWNVQVEFNFTIETFSQGIETKQKMWLQR